MCIEAEVEGEVARYTLSSTGAQTLGWMALGFGYSMGDSAMVIMWPSRDAEDGEYSSVTLSQRKAPYETMPLPDPDPPFVAELEVSATSVTGENPQMAFTRPAPPDGIQHIIWAFSRTAPESADANVDIKIHHEFGRGTLNLTRTAAAAPFAGDDADESGDGGVETGSIVSWLAGFVHAGLCMAAFLLVIPSGALVVRYAKLTGSSAAFDLHRNLQFGVAGAFIVAGVLAYLLMDTHGSDLSHKLWGAALVALYVVQCGVGFWVRRTPEEYRTRVQRITLAALGAAIVLLAFYDSWLGVVAAGHSPLFWSVCFVCVPPLFLLGWLVIQRRYASEGEGAKGEYVALDTRAPNDEVEVEVEGGEGHKDTDTRL